MQHKPVKFYDKYYVARAPSANAVSPDEKSKTSAENLGEHKSGDPDPWVFLPGTGIVRQQAARRFAKGYMCRRGRKEPDLPH